MKYLMNNQNQIFVQRQVLFKLNIASAENNRKQTNFSALNQNVYQAGQIIE